MDDLDKPAADGRIRQAQILLHAIDLSLTTEKDLHEMKLLGCEL
jgi:hypothetical protein